MPWRTVRDLRGIIDSQSYLLCADSNHGCSTACFCELNDFEESNRGRSSSLCTIHTCNVHLCKLLPEFQCFVFVLAIFLMNGNIFSFKRKNGSCVIFMNRHKIKDKHNGIDHLQTLSPFALSLVVFVAILWGVIFVLFISFHDRLRDSYIYSYTAYIKRA